MGALTPDEGLALLDAAMAADHPVMIPMHLESTRADPEQMPSLLRGLIRPRTRRVAGTAPAESAAAVLKERLASAPEAGQDAIVLDLAVTHVAAVLGYNSPDLIETERDFHELGFDSLTAIELRNRLNEVTGLRLSATLAFDYPTPAVLAGYLRQEIMRDVTRVAKRPPEQASAATRLLEEISRLERLIPGMAVGGEVRASLALRIRALLTALEEDHGSAGDDDLEAATMENIFELLDQEFGES
jgi:acyl carrier protein